VERPVQRCAGIRSAKFAEGCARIGLEALPLPLTIVPECFGCGADNSVDPFGSHTRGLHAHRPQGPNSYFVRALAANPAAQVAYGLRAVRLTLAMSPDGGVRADQLVVEDRRGRLPSCPGPQFCVRARQYVLAAGAISSTQVLQQSVRAHGLQVCGLGQRFTGNVVMPVYAVYDKPLPVQSTLPEPGIAQCFYTEKERTLVNDRPTIVQPAIENWFHHPGTLETVLTGWFDRYGQIARKYNNLAIAGMVVPTEVRAENRIDEEGKPRLEINDAEFELVLRGIERIGRIFLATATPDNGVTIRISTKALLLDARGCPLEVRSEAALQTAIGEIRCRGPEFLQLATAHPQGGNPLGIVVDPRTFRLQLADQRQVENLRVVDASVFPAGAEVNPQLALHAVAMYAADALLAAWKTGPAASTQRFRWCRRPACQMVSSLHEPSRWSNYSRTDALQQRNARGSEAFFRNPGRTSDLPPQPVPRPAASWAKRPNRGLTPLFAWPRMGEPR